MAQNNDLVTLSEAARELGESPMMLIMAHRRKLEGRHARDRDEFPEPAVMGRTKGLWSMRDLTMWWRSRTSA